MTNKTQLEAELAQHTKRVGELKTEIAAMVESAVENAALLETLAPDGRPLGDCSAEELRAFAGSITRWLLASVLRPVCAMRKPVPTLPQPRKSWK